MCPNPTPGIMIWTDMNLQYIRKLPHRIQIFWQNCFWEEDFQRFSSLYIPMWKLTTSISGLGIMILTDLNTDLLNLLEYILIEEVIISVNFSDKWFLTIRFYKNILDTFTCKNSLPPLWYISTPGDQTWIWGYFHISFIFKAITVFISLFSIEK